MKKFLSIVLVMMVLVISMSVPAFAANNDGTITISNATIGKDYKIYKIFDAAKTLDGTGVSYTIDPEKDPELFEALFGLNGESANEYLTYVASNKSVIKQKDINDSELISYLTKLVLGDDTQQGVTVAYTQEQKNVQSSRVVFENLPHGYYLITSSLGAAVSLDSNTPNVEIIDKNQKPGVIDKQVVTGAKDDVLEDPVKYVFAESSTANIGDLVTYKISFNATNYDGDQAIKYYQINDVKGDAIWAEFDSFTVKVGGKELKKGYYLPVGDVDNTGEWKWLGDWGKTPEAERNRNDADWYLVHLGYDQFRITIPWLEGHTIEGDDTLQIKPGPYTLKFPDNAQSRFTNSISTVEIYYEAAIEPTAKIGQTSDTNLYNTVYLSWVTPHDVFSGEEDRVTTTTYGIGLIKEDSVTRENLKDAVFEIYADEEHKVPVYVIPTNVDGVYIVDSLNCPSENITGLAMQNARAMYGTDTDGDLQRLTEYLGGATQKNQVVSQINGRLIILGLKDGDYYLVETEAPGGYNALRKHQKVTVDNNSSTFTIFANETTGEVADIQQADGTYSEVNYNLSTVIVQNSKGEELPSTGGAGTFWFITIGTLLAIGFAVFLITHKKMSVYTD